MLELVNPGSTEILPETTTIKKSAVMSFNNTLSYMVKLPSIKSTAFLFITTSGAPPGEPKDTLPAAPIQAYPPSSGALAISLVVIIALAVRFVKFLPRAMSSKNS